MASKVYEVAVRIAASIAKTFKGDTLGAAGALTKLTGAAKQLQSAEKAAASYKKLDAAVASSKARYGQAAEALRRLEEAEKAAGGATKESAKWRAAGERELAKYAREMDRATKAAEKNAQAMRNLPAARFEAARERLFGARKQDSTPLFQKAGAQMRSVAGDAMFLATAAGGAAVALGGIAFKTLQAADEIGDTADKLGIGTTALQELRYGAEQSGAEVGALDKGLGKMAVTIGKFKNAKGKGGGGAMEIPGLQMLGTGGGGGEAGAGGEQDPFKRLGLSAKALAALKPDEQMLKIANGMAKLKTHADKAAVAQAIFGKGGKEMLPFLEEGAAGIKKLSEQAHKYGGIMSPEAIKNADLADKALRDAKMAVGGLTNTLGAALLPTAISVFKEFSSWVASNREAIQKWASGAAKWITDTAIPAIKKGAAEFTALAGKVMSVVSTGAQLVGGFGNLALIIGGLRLAPLISTFGQIGVQGFKAAFAIGQYVIAQNAMAVGQGASAITSIGGLAATFGVAAIAAGAVSLAVWRIYDAVKELGGLSAVWQDVKDFTTSGMGNKPQGGPDPLARWLFGDKQAEKTAGMPMPATAAAGGARGPLIGSMSIAVGQVTKDEASRQLAAAFDDVQRKVMAEIDRQQREQRRRGDGV